MGVPKAQYDQLKAQTARMTEDIAQLQQELQDRKDFMV